MVSTVCEGVWMCVLPCVLGVRVCEYSQCLLLYLRSPQFNALTGGGPGGCAGACVGPAV